MNKSTYFSEASETLKVGMGLMDCDYPVVQGCGQWLDKIMEVWCDTAANYMWQVLTFRINK